MYENYKLPVLDPLNIAWKKVSGTKGSILLGFLIAFLIGASLIGVAYLLGHYFVISISLSFIQRIVQFLTTAGLLLIGLKRAYDLPFSYKMIFTPFKARLALKLILLAILKFCIYLPFIALFILIPTGLYLLSSTFHAIFAPLQAMISILLMCILVFLYIRMSLTTGFVLVRDSGSWEAIKLSFAATRGNFWRLLALKLLELTIMVISSIPLGIGLIWGLPLMLITEGEIYKKLSANVEAKKAEPITIAQ